MSNGPNNNNKTIARKCFDQAWASLVAYLEGGVTGISFLSLGTTIGAGVSVKIDNAIMKGSIQYAVPPIALFDAIEFLLEKYQSIRLLRYRLLWQALRSNVRLASFLAPLFFFAIAEICRLVEGIPNDKPVDISNAAAAVIISIFSSLSTVEGLKIYYDGADKALADQNITPLDPKSRSMLQKTLRFISTNPVTRGILAILDGASSLHWLVYSIQAFGHVSNMPFQEDLRYFLTVLAGIIAGIFHSQADDQKRFSYKLLTYLLLLIKALSLGLSSYEDFTVNKETWGEETLREQALFWFLFFPSFLVLFQVGMGLFSKFQARRHTEQSQESTVRTEEDVPLLFSKIHERERDNKPKEPKELKELEDQMSNLNISSKKVDAAPSYKRSTP